MYTIKEVAAKLRVSDKTVQRMISGKEITSILVRGQRRIPQAALDEYLKRYACEAL